MTSRQYGKRAIFVSGDVRFQDGDAVDLGKLGDRFLSSTSFFQCMHPARVYVSSCTRVGLPYYYGTAACATFAYFLCTMHVNIAPIRFNNVSLCPSIFISNISGLLLRPRVLNPARRLASLMH